MKKTLSLVSNYNLEPLERVINSHSKIYSCKKFNFSSYDSQLIKSKSDYVLIVLDADSVFYELRRFHESKKKIFDYKKLNLELDSFYKKIDFFSKKQFVYLFNFIKYSNQPFVSSNFLTGKNSIKYILNYINNYLADKFSKNKNLNFLDLNDYLNEFEGKYHDIDFYIATKSFFTLEFYEYLYQKVEKLFNIRNKIPKKILLLDLDDTLWGGTVGEVGLEKINLGGNDIYGESFLNFQKSILILKKQGIQLGIVSKNDEKTALSTINRHPEMLLKEKDFSIIKINWKRKTENILNISKELNLNLDSIVFFDNDLHEREEIKENLPSVMVPDISAGPLYYSKILNELNCFENSFFTNEDINRTKYYKDNSKRDKLLSKIKDKNEWLKELKIKIKINKVNKSSIDRAIQLLNKTNQMNMRTNRYTDNEFKNKYVNKGAKGQIFVATVEDKFGSYGLTGIISYITTHNNYEIQDFVLSCRVMGRGVEESLVNFIKNKATKDRKNLFFRYSKTEKNKPMLDFLKKCRLLKNSKKNLFQA
jgi:FkbH-like protein